MSGRDARTLHAAVYPFENLNIKTQILLSDRLERNFLIKDLLTERKPDVAIEINFHAIAKAMRYIQDNLYLDPDCLFVDILGVAGSAALFASSFDVARAKSIEIREEGTKLARSVIEKMKSDKKNRTKFTLKTGCMLDYFWPDANLVYINCHTITNESTIDEATLLLHYFKLCEQLLPGSYLIVVTNMVELYTKNVETDLHVYHVQYLYDEVIDDPDPVIGKVTVWILKTRSPVNSYALTTSMSSRPSSSYEFELTS